MAQIDGRPLPSTDHTPLLNLIRAYRCTPFLGAGINAGVLETGTALAERWAAEFNYPLPDRQNLARVAHYMRLQNRIPQDIIRKEFTGKQPNYSQADEPHAALAKLPFPVYVTTNYDDFMEQALIEEDKEPQRILCAWYPGLRNQDLPPTLSLKPDFDADPEENVKHPVVFHLHGHVDLPASLVLTEDDYIDFLVNWGTPHRFTEGSSKSKSLSFLPSWAEEALAAQSMLFIGYSMTDLNFLVIFRAINSLRRNRPEFEGRTTEDEQHIAVQLPPTVESVKGTDTLDPNTAVQRAMQAKQYLEKYYQRRHIDVFWMDSREFVRGLLDQW